MKTSPHIPEIEQIEEYKDRLREEWMNEFGNPPLLLEELTKEMSRCALCGIKAEKIADWWLDRLDSYAQMKIDQLFNEENKRKGLRIR